MKYKFLLSTVLLALFFVPSANAGTSPIPPKCEHELCNVIAKEIQFSHTPLADSLLVKVGNFQIHVPKNFNKMDLMEQDIYFFYPKNRVLIVGLSKGILVEGTKLKKLSPNAFPEIVYIKTPSDLEPHDNDDLLYWRLALQQKVDYFTNVISVNSMINGDLKYYMTTNKSEHFTNQGMVSDSRSLNSFLRIDAKNFKDDVFKQIITSAKGK